MKHKIYIAGQEGMVGQAIYKLLKKKYLDYIILEGIREISLI